jgi:outer membrane lipoprotein-sorting protein
VSLTIAFRRLAPVLGLAALLATPAAFAAQQPAPANVDTVLHQLDLASAGFKSVAADIRIDLFERVVQDTSTECGLIYYQRQGATTQMDLRSTTSPTNSCPATAASAPASRVINYSNGTLKMFEPQANHLTLLTAGSNQATVESFLTLGFGASGRDLAKAWDITDQGTETLNDGSKSVNTVKLKLVAKDPAILKNITSVVIWIDPVRGISLKQQFVTPSGDSKTTYFTNIRYNQKVDTKEFAINTNKQTQIDRH